MLSQGPINWLWQNWFNAHIKVLLSTSFLVRRNLFNGCFKRLFIEITMYQDFYCDCMTENCKSQSSMPVSSEKITLHKLVHALNFTFLYVSGNFPRAEI